MAPFRRGRAVRARETLTVPRARRVLSSFPVHVEIPGVTFQDYFLHPDGRCHLLEMPGLTTAWERLDPFYDSLRGRKDFQALVGGS